jgi:ribosomal protein L11 methyltransferase
MDYIELEIKVDPILPWREVLITQLAEIGFESFTEEKEGLKAYIPNSAFNNDEFGAILSQARALDATIEYEENLIKHQNWNAQWESGFEPVVVDNQLIIKAPFHSLTEQYPVEIIIAPQMSFGTGHHDTTYLLCKAMLAMEWKETKVLDAGTGTGVLAILAQFLGANRVMGTEIDKGSFENAQDNLLLNNCSDIALFFADIKDVPHDGFDVIIANINKNVLKNHLPYYGEKIREGGTLLMSGFFETDIDELNESASQVGFSLLEKFVQQNWAVVKYAKI